VRLRLAQAGCARILEFGCNRKCVQLRGARRVATDINDKT
jgi:hypothetical protein